MPLTSVASMAANETQHQHKFAYQQQLHLTERKRTNNYILYFGFSIGFSCQADEFKIQARQQAVSR